VSEHFEEPAGPAHPSDEGIRPTEGAHEEVPQVEPTGNPDVDAVVASLADLDARPVSEHVAVFESAHDRLRSALADAGNQPSGS
jgi:hypothetical protein